MMTFWVRCEQQPRWATKGGPTGNIWKQDKVNRSVQVLHDKLGNQIEKKMFLFPNLLSTYYNYLENIWHIIKAIKVQDTVILKRLIKKYQSINSLPKTGQISKKIDQHGRHNIYRVFHFLLFKAHFITQ